VGGHRAVALENLALRQQVANRTLFGGSVRVGICGPVRTDLWDEAAYGVCPSGLSGDTYCDNFNRQLLAGIQWAAFDGAGRCEASSRSIGKGSKGGGASNASVGVYIWDLVLLVCKRYAKDAHRRRGGPTARITAHRGEFR
jgi:hypothetical protein